MKKIFHPLIVLLFFTACQSNEESTSATASQADSVITPETVLELPYNAQFNEQTQKVELNATQQKGTKLNMSEMVSAINIKYPEIKLELLKTGHDTAYVKIDNAAFLSERLGSAGAMVYLAESTFAITEIPGIKAVNFNFKEGDHASPGTYTRQNFNADNL